MSKAKGSTREEQQEIKEEEKKRRKRQNARAVKIVKKMLARKMELRRQAGVRWWNEDNIVAVAEMSTVVVRPGPSFAARQLWPSGQTDDATRVQFAEKGWQHLRLMLLHFLLLLFVALTVSLSVFSQQLVEFYLFCVNW